jgi:hypothetical protein
LGIVHPKKTPDAARDFLKDRRMPADAPFERSPARNSRIESDYDLNFPSFLPFLKNHLFKNGHKFVIFNIVSVIQLRLHSDTTRKDGDTSGQ